MPLDIFRLKRHLSLLKAAAEVGATMAKKQGMSLQETICNEKVALYDDLLQYIEAKGG